MGTWGRRWSGSIPLSEASVGLLTRGYSIRAAETELRGRGASAKGAKHATEIAFAQLKLVAQRAIPEAEARQLNQAMALPINLYFVLGVTPVASDAEIGAAYRAKARLCHPDLHHSQVEDAALPGLMALVNQARQVLINPRLRAIYQPLWLRRSGLVTAANQVGRDRRGDWLTRSLWAMAEIGAVEDRLLAIWEDRDHRRTAAFARPMVLETIGVYEDLADAALTTLHCLSNSLPRIAQEARTALYDGLGVMARLAVLADGDEGGTGDRALASAELSRLRQAHHLLDLDIASEILAGEAC